MGEPLIQLVEELKRLDRKRAILKGKLPAEDETLYNRIKVELSKRLGTGSDATRRDAIRVQTSLRVRYHTGQTFINNYIGNMSLGGVFIVTPNPLPLDTKIDLHLFFEDEQREVVVEGKVVWENTQQGKNKDVTRAGMGVKFTAVSDDARKVVEKLVHSKLEERAKAEDNKKENQKGWQKASGPLNPKKKP